MAGAGAGGPENFFCHAFVRTDRRAGEYLRAVPAMIIDSDYFLIQKVPKPVEEIRTVAIWSDAHVGHVPDLALSGAADDETKRLAASAVCQLNLSV